MLQAELWQRLTEPRHRCLIKQRFSTDQMAIWSRWTEQKKIKKIEIEGHSADICWLSWRHFYNTFTMLFGFCVTCLLPGTLGHACPIALTNASPKGLSARNVDGLGRGWRIDTIKICCKCAMKMQFKGWATSLDFTMRPHYLPAPLPEEPHTRNSYF